MAIKKSQLYTKLWKACDELRGGMDASQYKDYVLVVLFIKYLSDKVKSGAEGYIELPEGCSFDDLVALKNKSGEVQLKGDLGRANGIGEAMNKIIAAIEEANETLSNVLRNADFCDEQKLGKGKALVETVSNLIGVFQDKDLDFSNNRAADDDLIGDAYEYLMKNFATQSGKAKGQFYTPAEPSRVMAKLLGIANDTRKSFSIYDPTCGSGSLLLRNATEARNPAGVSIEGQELDLATIGMAKMSMVIHGVDDAELKHGNTIAEPLHRVDDTHLKTFDYAVANPPFSVKNWMKGAQENDPFGRWGHGEGVAPVPPPKCGDYAFFLHLIHSLKSNGKGAIILPHGVLFRGNAEAEVRKFIVERRYISGIVGLPANLFFGTGIPACIIVVDKGAALTSKGIFMIDAKDGFIKDGDKNRLRESDIKRITDAWEAKADIPHFSRLVSYEEIERNDFNLNIPRYIAPEDKEVHQDIVAHLKGGIPEVDAAAFPTSLFKPLRKGYVKLAVPMEGILAALDSDPNVVDSSRKYGEMCAHWLEYFGTEAGKIKIGTAPKKLIGEMSGWLLQDAKKCGALVNAYDVYDILMNYWNETMQDDVYLVSRDGWKVELAPPAKKNATWESYVCDLLPVEVVARACFQAEVDAIGAMKVKLEELTASIDELDEKLADESVAEEVDEDEVKAERKKLDQKVKALKKEIKESGESLTAKIVSYYAKLDEATLKKHVIVDKWTESLKGGFNAELARVKANVVTGVKALSARYAETLPAAERAVSDLSVKVARHLSAMGIEL